MEIQVSTNNTWELEFDRLMFYIYTDTGNLNIVAGRDKFAQGIEAVLDKKPSTIWLRVTTRKLGQVYSNKWSEPFPDKCCLNILYK